MQKGLHETLSAVLQSTYLVASSHELCGDPPRIAVGMWHPDRGFAYSCHDTMLPALETLDRIQDSEDPLPISGIVLMLVEEHRRIAVLSGASKAGGPLDQVAVYGLVPDRANVLNPPVEALDLGARWIVANLRAHGWEVQGTTDPSHEDDPPLSDEQVIDAIVGFMKSHSDDEEAADCTLWNLLAWITTVCPTQTTEQAVRSWLRRPEGRFRLSDEMPGGEP